MATSRRRVTAPDLVRMKLRGERIAMLTSYDFTMARLLDRAGVDVLLVGDSLGMVVLGYDNTLAVTLDAVVHHTAAVSRGASRALVVADMPFLSCHTGVPDAVRAAGRLVREGGAQAVKVEGGHPVLEVVQRLVEAGIPVMGHLGLTPQSVHQLGGFRKQVRTRRDAEKLLESARALEAAGACAIVLEMIPHSVAAEATTALQIPTIGIGAGPHCDGQVLVTYDALGLYDEFVPSFVKRYADLGSEITAAAEEYAKEVREGSFPAIRKSALSGARRD
ncbi:MAG: 3-methyl-2-oxobutanoate hydroxymethyltransferase [Bryobacterales bacterium]|nr:3-methyl-2-oxobutanoate hydroxymethyltransferase [Bryobacterales bacterium]MDE0627186.1 3-methyl-2-oxobutanoate hydroxymethyltransferase [Bryobacterales bacterium]